LVNELLQSGIITEEAATNHKKKNVITRAMQPHLEKPCKADIKPESDVQAGDYFFLCTDGVLESVSDEQLCSIISRNNTDEEMMQAIYNLCEAHSRDNFSAYLVPVIEGITLSEAKSVTVIEEEDEVAIAPQPTDPPRPAAVVPPLKKKAKTPNIILILIILALLAIGVFFVAKKGALKQVAEPSKKTPIREQQKPQTKSDTSHCLNSSPSPSTN
jgi:hypothetical protein